MTLEKGGIGLCGRWREGRHLPLADASSRQKKTCGGRKRTGRPVLKCWTGTEYSYKYRRIPGTRLAKCTTVSTEEYRNEIGPAYHYKYRRIQDRNRPSVPLEISKNPGSESAQRCTINIKEYRNEIGTAYHYKYRRIQ